MKVIKPWIKVQEFNGIEIMKNIEKACRTCYRSEGNISDYSYKNLLKNCIGRGHQSILEHEKITIRMCCDLGVYKDLTRHRIASFSIESTRYCCYDKDKFNGEITFIEPLINDTEKIENQYTEERLDAYGLWAHQMMDIEETYMSMRKLGCTPDECRMILPHSIAAEVVMTANIREWRHILSLRATKMVHPTIQQLMIPLLLYFKEEMPELFLDIDYNTEFDKNKYAKIIKN